MVSKVVQKFDSQGFVILRGHLSAGCHEELNRELARYISAVVPTLPATEAFFEVAHEATTLKQLPRMETHDPWFEALRREPAFEQVAAELLGEDVVPQSVQYFCKPARIGKQTAPHQDGWYFMLEPNQAVTLWLPIASVDEDNGCVRYVPGSHRQGLRQHEASNLLGFSQQIADYGEADRQREVCAPVEPGDMLVHHSLTIHRADANTSERPRPAMGIVYFAAASRVDRERREAYLQQLNAKITADAATS